MRRALTAGGASLAIGGFFIIKIASGLFLLKLSAAWLSVADFGIFAQFLLLGALITTIAVAGAQNGIVRQVAAGDEFILRRAVSAGFLLWSVTLALVIALATLFAAHISVALTGSPHLALTVPAVAIAAMLSGPGQIACSALTGLGHTRASLGAQAAGLLASTAAAAILIARGQAAAAAVAFYAGALVTAPIAWPMLRAIVPNLMLRHAGARAEARHLLGFGAALVSVAGSSALILFGLRYAYLQATDPRQLGYWLVAQRISDTSTQLLGLFMMQYFVPAYAAAPVPSRRGVVWRSWLLGSAAMLVLLLAFAAAPRLWVPLLLSSAYLPAVGMILVYMAGDMLRTSASLAMHSALAESRIVTFAAIEIATMTLMAVITLVLIAARQPLAPALGYLLAYLGAALVIAVVVVIRRRRRALAPV